MKGIIIAILVAGALVLATPAQARVTDHRLERLKNRVEQLEARVDTLWQWIDFLERWRQTFASRTSQLNASGDYTGDISGFQVLAPAGFGCFGQPAKWSGTSGRLIC